MQTLFDVRRKWLVGVVHVKPLPGSPRWDGNMDAVLRAAVVDARAYAKGGADAIEFENFGDIPFTKFSVPPETVAGLAAVASAVRQEVRLPLGFNVLRNDARAAIALAAACDGSFVRINVHTGAMVTDQGIIEGNAYETIRRRQALCPQVQILADVHVKHAVPLGPQRLEVSAWDTLHRGGADGLIISGESTGAKADLADLTRVRKALPQAALFLGSGVTLENVGEFMPYATGFIVGSSLKKAGGINQPVDPRRVAALARRVHRAG